MINKDGVWFQVGTPVLSFTTTINVRPESCVYNRIGPRCDWIRTVTDGEVECVVAEG